MWAGMEGLEGAAGWGAAARPGDECRRGKVLHRGGPSMDRLPVISFAGRVPLTVGGEMWGVRPSLAGLRVDPWRLLAQRIRPAV